jgi:ATP-binding cassette, subfamily F, member 3
MLYEIKDGSVSLGGKTILSHFSFEIKGREHIAIVGRNGSGKTTLLNVITGKLDLDRNDKNPDAGISHARSFSMGILEQTADGQALERTVEENILDGILSAKTEEFRYSKERYDYEVRYDKMLTNFGFAKEDKQKKLKEFSGGEQKKILLIRLILAEPDLLILDEPTNHLDISATEWLERYLIKYPKAVLMVSHDRYFIDKTADVIWEVSQGKTIRYTGNYTAYRKEKAENYTRQLKQYEAQQEEIRHLNELIEKFKHKPKKASFARSRKKILERMEKVEKPVRDEACIRTEEIIPEKFGSKWVFQCEHLKFGYEKPIKEISFRLRRGKKIGIYGPNGSGKSTFLKTVGGLLEPCQGKIKEGNNIDLAYFDQMISNLDSDQNILEWFHDLYPSLIEKEIRQLLAGYLFQAKDLGKKVKDLSGGEKARLKIASLLQAKPNFLILDEPTNNMDIPAKETLESIFQAYQGTILFVSHDRYFLSHVADALLIFEPEEEEVLYYPFGYDHYQERKENALFGENIAALRTAEQQRMIEELKAVPEKEKHRLKEISTRQATFDWEFSLNEEERRAAELKFADLQKKQEMLQSSEAYYLEKNTEEKLPQSDEATYEEHLSEEEALKKEEQEALDEWTKQCLEYYDIYLDTLDE